MSSSSSIQILAYRVNLCVRLWPRITLTWHYSSSFRWILLSASDESLQPAINCVHAVSGGWACLLRGYWSNWLCNPTHSLSGIDILSAKFLMFLRGSLFWAVFLDSTWRWEQSSVLGKSVMQWLMDFLYTVHVRDSRSESPGRLWWNRFTANISGLPIRSLKCW